jgi:hypothetical protein
MANENKPSFFERLRGKRTSDINLPNESGQIDSRLSDPAEIIKGIENNPALKALRAYGAEALKQEKKR